MLQIETEDASHRRCRGSCRRGPRSRLRLPWGCRRGRGPTCQPSSMTSMRSIAAEANMTTGAIYYYYKNKQDLFDEIVTDSIHFAHRIFHENENEKITVDSLFSDVEKEARIRFKRLQEEKLYLLLLSDAMKCDSEFSQKYTSGLKSYPV